MTHLSRRPALALIAAPLLLAAQQPATQAPMIPAPPPPEATVPAPSPAAAPVPQPHVVPSLSDRQIAQIRDFLGTAAANGIAPSDRDSAAPESGDTTALVEAAMDYAHALHSGRLAPGDFLNDWGLRPQPFDPWPGFVAAVKDDRLKSWFASLPPPWAGYDTLKKALANYRAIQKAGGWPQVPAGPAIGLGATGDRVAALRRRLAVEDDALPKGADSFDADVVAALQRAQRRYGLDPDGTLGPQTLAALNVPARDRVRQIEANMERWRWLPAQLAERRVQVNIAAAVLTMFDGDQPVTSMRAVTGRPGDETPMLQSEIRSIVFNPPWNVPSSIAKKELWPKERAHPGYLKAHDFRVIGSGADARLQQVAGPKAALGRVKFDFANNYGVYLHDTPTQSTFDRYSRLASHGCVRLARPVDLARLMLKGSAEWTPEKIDTTLAPGNTKTVRAMLDDPVAVYLLYWTAYATPDGSVSFLGDPYGWDSALADRIQAGANRARAMTATP